MKTIIFSLFLFHSQPKEQTILVNLSKFEWTAYDYDGKIVNSGQASGGRRWCEDIKKGCKTPYGFFYVINKRGPHYRSPLYPLNKKIKAPMFWAVRFSWFGPSFHQSNDNWNIKKHQSHGCIHLKKNDAWWINLFSNSLTKIIILPY
jgi:lipoprotein-anchoring transpeptidase ErfK/SrfK